MNNDKDTVKLEEAYKQIQEGFFDRQKAKLAGVGGGLKGLKNSIAGTVKGAIAGVNNNVAGVQAAAQQKAQGGITANAKKAKLASITKTFQNEMASLFGGNWATTYPDIAKALQNTQTATPPPLPGAARSDARCPESRNGRTPSHRSTARSVPERPAPRSGPAAPAWRPSARTRGKRNSSGLYCGETCPIIQRGRRPV